MKTDFDWGPDGDLWSSGGPATVEQKMKILRQRLTAIAFVRTFIAETEKYGRISGDGLSKAKAFIFDVEHT